MKCIKHYCFAESNLRTKNEITAFRGQQPPKRANGIGMSQREHVGVRQRFLADQLRSDRAENRRSTPVCSPSCEEKTSGFLRDIEDCPVRTELRRLEPGGSPDSAPVETSVPEQLGRLRPVNLSVFSRLGQMKRPGDPITAFASGRRKGL